MAVESMELDSPHYTIQVTNKNWKARQSQVHQQVHQQIKTQVKQQSPPKPPPTPIAGQKRSRDEAEPQDMSYTQPTRPNIVLGSDEYHALAHCAPREPYQRYIRSVGGAFGWVLSHTIGALLSCLGGYISNVSNDAYKRALVYVQRETVAAVSTTSADNKRRMVGAYPESPSPSPKKKIHAPADARTSANAVRSAENDSQGPSTQTQISQAQSEMSMPVSSDSSVTEEKPAENDLQGPSTQTQISQERSEMRMPVASDNGITQRKPAEKKTVAEETIPIMKRSTTSQKSAEETLPTPPDSRPTSSHSTSSRRSAWSQRSAYDDEAIRRNREAYEDAEHAADEACEMEQRAKQLKGQLEREQQFKKRQREAAKKKADEEKAKKQAEQEKLEAQKKAEQEELEAQKEADAKYWEDWLLNEYVTKQAIITELDEEWNKIVDDAMSTRNPRGVIAQGQNGVEITRRDFGHILPQKGMNDRQDGWLNDEIVNAFMASLVAATRLDNKDSKGEKPVPYCAAFSTGWWKSYHEKGMQGISRWSRRLGIQNERLLGCYKIYFPINTGNHWTLLMICPREGKRIVYLDSLGHGRAPEMFRIARKWLKMELGDKYVEDDWTDSYESDDLSSIQSNNNDCGVFVCFNALATAKGHPLTSVDADNMPQARRLLAAILINGGLHGRYKF